jgi:hypothetical protein
MDTMWLKIAFCVLAILFALIGWLWLNKISKEDYNEY